MVMILETEPKMLAKNLARRTIGIDVMSLDFSEMFQMFKDSTYDLTMSFPTKNLTYLEKRYHIFHMYIDFHNLNEHITRNDGTMVFAMNSRPIIEIERKDSQVSILPIHPGFRPINQKESRNAFYVPAEILTASLYKFLKNVSRSCDAMTPRLTERLTEIAQAELELR